MNGKKAMIAMSGGVDSSVAAKLMCDMGYDCVGVTMRLYDNDIVESKGKTCCSEDDVYEARMVAYKLGMQFLVFNFIEEFKENVITKFVSSYEMGATPNPCIDCNRYMKFDKLSERAKVLGYDYVVTGHYAVIDFDEQSGRYRLRKAVDHTKDQSYVLYSLTQEQLKHTLFPLGGYTKTQIRKIAEENGFINAKKRDSQDICFVPDGDYASFIKRYTGKEYPAGDYISLNGEKLGKHSGIINYTIGQRKGLGIALGHPAFVIEKDILNNTVTLGENKDLFYKKVYVKDINALSVGNFTDGMRLKARLRYNQVEQPAVLYKKGDGVVLEFDEPQRAPSAGQSAVFYNDDIVLGGGIIEKGEK